MKKNKLEKDVWKKITELAHLNISKEEKELIFPQIENMILHFKRVEQIPTDSITPLVSPAEEPLFLREDKVEMDCQNSNPLVKNANNNDKKKFLLDQAVSLEGSFVKVPQVIDSSK